MFTFLESSIFQLNGDVNISFTRGDKWRNDLLSVVFSPNSTKLIVRNQNKDIIVAQTELSIDTWSVIDIEIQGNEITLTVSFK